MPELPEVETIVRTLRPLVLGKTIATVHALNPASIQGPHLLKSLVGGTVRELARRGKLALVFVDGAEQTEAEGLEVGEGLEVVEGFAVHLKMTGRLFVYPKGTAVGPHTRVVIDFTDGTRLFFDDARKFGYLRVLSEQSQAQWNFWQTLGPEPLEMRTDAFANALGRRNAGIKSLLLNQTVVAGIGNIYADESLFRAGIHPTTRATTIPQAQLCALHEQVVEVLKESIEACGSSIKDYRTARGDAGAFQNAFRVYGRGGKACVVCGTELTSQTVAGRTTVFCQICQKRAG